MTKTDWPRLHRTVVRETRHAESPRRLRRARRQLVVGLVSLGLAVLLFSQNDPSRRDSRGRSVDNTLPASLAGFVGCALTASGLVPLLGLPWGRPKISVLLGRAVVDPRAGDGPRVRLSCRGPARWVQETGPNPGLAFPRRARRRGRTRQPGIHATEVWQGEKDAACSRALQSRLSSGEPRQMLVGVVWEGEPRLVVGTLLD